MPNGNGSVRMRRILNQGSVGLITRIHRLKNTTEIITLGSIFKTHVQKIYK